MSSERGVSSVAGQRFLSASTSCSTHHKHMANFLQRLRRVCVKFARKVVVNIPEIIV